MPRRLLAALDAGTTSTRCVLFDPETAAPVASVGREQRQITPRPGWLEHDPAELWANAAAVVAEALARANAGAEDVVAVGLTNQRETTLLWERSTGRPLHNAIVWSDARTADLCDRLISDGGADRFRDATGLPVSTYFSATKLSWLLDHVPGARGRAGRGELCFGTVDTWLLWHLTGRFVTDVTNASRTLLSGLRELDWRDDLLQALDIPRDLLPTIQPSIGGDFGVTKKRGLFAGEVAVTAVLGDQQAALFGQGCLSPGQAKNTYGTGCFLLMNTGDAPVASTHGLLTTPAYQIAGQDPVYALEGSVAVAGSVVQWLRDNMGLIGTSPDVEPLADSVQDAGGVTFVPAFGGLFAPHWDAAARGTILGLTAQTTRAHLARAALDSVCYQTADVVDAMRADSGFDLTGLRVDGGMAVNDRLLQFQADVLGVAVTRPAYAESTALGAARAAGRAVSLKMGESAGGDRTFEPDMGQDQRQTLRETWRRAVGRSRGWAGG